MPYCHTEFQIVKPKQVENVLTMFTQECFVGGQAAYRLDDGSFSIDAGENDIRAIYEEPNAAIKFFCRYKQDMNFYDNKLQAFATKHGIDTGLPVNTNTDGNIL
ncbi:hypothetical protein AX660_05920 [Paraglaciecola hydrolytica]|uniref:Uncharacterized protein n=2 Tax=Paraglaciecola hydrolytica TaxID=1799789 RepID=A0A136A386_9ALTE|nr:hypothetical protein AX660_05920 [Paraglaciecola hydrolytica]